MLSNWVNLLQYVFQKSSPLLYFLSLFKQIFQEMISRNFSKREHLKIINFPIIISSEFFKIENFFENLLTFIDLTKFFKICPSFRVTVVHRITYVQMVQSFTRKQLVKCHVHVNLIHHLSLVQLAIHVKVHKPNL